MNYLREIGKLIVSQFFIITVGILFCTSVGNLFYEDVVYPAWYPWMIMLTGLVGSLPTALFHFRKEPTRKQFIIRTIIHFIVIEILIMTLGYIFGWYSEFIGGLIIFGMILAVYAFVWFFSIRMDMSLAKNINAALERMNREE